MFGTLPVPAFPLVMVLMLAYVGVIVVPASMICRRIGKPWWLGLLALVPLVNLALLWFVAIARWDVPLPVNRAA